MPVDKQKTLRLAFRTFENNGQIRARTSSVNKCSSTRYAVFASGVQEGRASIGRLCNHLKKVTKSDQFSDAVCTEWLLYASDSNLDSETSNFGGDMCLLETRFHNGRH